MVAQFQSAPSKKQQGKRGLETPDTNVTEKIRTRAPTSTPAAAAAAAAQKEPEKEAVTPAAPEQGGRAATTPKTAEEQPSELPLAGDETRLADGTGEMDLELAAEKPPAAATAHTIAKTVGAVDVALLPATRKDMLAALPSLEGDGEETEQYHTILLVPMRSGPAAEFGWNEATKIPQIHEKLIGLAGYMDGLLKDWNPGDGLSLAKVSPQGNVDLQMQRAAAEKNKSRGVAALRVMSFFGSHLEAVLEAGGIMVEPANVDELTCEMAAETDLYPGCVMEQIYKQNDKLRSYWKYDSDAKMNCYQFEPSMEQRHAIAKRGFLVKLGDEGTFGMRAVSGQASVENFYLYGMTGVGSAKLLAQPALSKRLGLSKDLVRVSGFNGTRRGAGFVAMITIPFSRKNLDAMHRMFQEERFRIGNSNVDGYFTEIYVAPTPVEMEKLLAFKLLSAPVDDSPDELAEKAKDLSLRIVEGVLIRALEEDLTLTALPRAEVFRTHTGPLGGHSGRSEMRTCNPTRNCAFPTGCNGSKAKPARAFSLWQSTLTTSLSSQKRTRLSSGAGGPGSETTGSGGERGQGERTDRGGGKGGHEHEVAPEDHWRVRPMDHLLGWGFDARGRGGRRCK